MTESHTHIKEREHHWSGPSPLFFVSQVRRAESKRREACLTSQVKLKVQKNLHPSGFSGKESACQHQRSRFDSLGWEDPLEKGNGNPGQSRILARRIPWTEEPGGHSPWGRKESDSTE